MSLNAKSRFVVEELPSGNPCLKNPASPQDGPIAMFSEGGVTYGGGKGGFKFDRIEKVVVSIINDDNRRFDLYIPENKAWNERVQKEHPIRWKLGLIHKDKAQVFCLGTSERREDADSLSEYLVSKGVSVEEAAS